MKQIKKVGYLIGVLMAIGACVLLYVGLLQVGMGIFAGMKGIEIPEDILYEISGTIGVAITGIVVYFFVRKKKYFDDLPNKQFHLLSGLSFAFLAISLIMVILDTITALLLHHTFPIMDKVTHHGVGKLDIILTVVVAPIFEELLFRVGLYSLIRRKFSMTTSAIISMVIFACAHGYQIQGLISCIIMGGFLMLLYLKTGNIKYCVFTHMCSNIVATVMNALERNGATILGAPIQYEMQGYNMFHWIVVVIAIMYCVAYFGYKIYNKKQLKFVVRDKCVSDISGR